MPTVPWDAVVCVGFPVIARTRALPVSGLPVMFASLVLSETFRIFPSSMEKYGWPDMLQLLLLFICMDSVQTAVHYCTHRGWLGSTALRHHHVHHRHVKITTRSAFCTGWLDSLVQLVAPLFCVLQLVRPNRTTALVFGVMYSQWLLYIHTPDTSLRFPGLVTPAYHQAHHSGKGHYTHVFPVF